MDINEKMNLYLIGYMGTGKTTVGRLLAKKMNRSFIDVDGFIENRYYKTVSALFEEKGESGFREIERHALQEISGFENMIVSTGGGLPCFFDNMDLLNRTGFTIYLKASVDELFQRINSNKQKRPLVKEKNSEELYDFIETNLKKRELFYNQATLIVDIPHFHTRKDINQWVEELLNNF
jgi:shikimate kinase